MINYRTPLSALLFTGLVIASLWHTHISGSKAINQLYVNEEAGEQAAYNFQRLRDPQLNAIPDDIRKKELQFAASLPVADESGRSTTWQNRGPFNLGGRTRALALDVTNENIILAGGVTSGMWRSTDGGNSFTKSTQPQQIHSTTCVAQDKRQGKTNVWYYGTGELYGIVNATSFSSQFSGDGIFKSTDGGISWTQLPSTVSGTPASHIGKRDMDFVWEIVPNPTNLAEDEVLAATVNGIWRSIDGGQTWSVVLGLDTSVATISEHTDLAITSDGVFYAAISSETPSKGIYRSTNGINWTKIVPSGFPATYNRVEIGIAPSDETQVYFIAEAPGAGTTGHSLYHYKYLGGDGSGSNGVWTNRTTNIPDDNCTGFYTFDFRKFSSQTSYDLYVVVHPTDPNFIFLGGTNIYRSYDGFSTPAYNWIGGYQCDSSKISNYVYPNHHPDQHKLLFLPSNSNIAISASDGGLMKTQNIFDQQVTWTEINNGYNTGQFYTCAIEPGNTSNPVIIGGLQDNGTMFTGTDNYYQPWKKVFYGDGAYCAITRNRTNYYLSWQTGKVFKFDISDNGTVNNLSRIDPQGGSGYAFITPFILDPLSDNRMYLCAGRTIWRNDSLPVIPMTGNEYSTISQGWTKLNGTTTGASIGSPNISNLDISEANSNILYFGTDRGSVYRLDSAATNNLSSKINITGTNFSANAYVSCVETDRLNHNNVMVTFSNYGVKSIFYTSDAGATWTDVSGNLEQNPDGSGNGPSVTWAHIYNNGSSVKYYVGTSVGLFSTETLNGINTVWAQEGSNTIGNVVINMITSRVYDENIVVATHGNGMYSNKQFVSAIPSSDEESEIKIWPNPANDILFVSTNTNVPYTLFDLSGRQVSKGFLQKGSNEIDLTMIGSGAFIIQCGRSTRRFVKL